MNGTYYYVIVAFNPSGVSNFSNEQSVNVAISAPITVTLNQNVSVNIYYIVISAVIIVAGIGLVIVLKKRREPLLSASGDTGPNNFWPPSPPSTGSTPSNFQFPPPYPLPSPNQPIGSPSPNPSPMAPKPQPEKNTD